MRGTCRKVVVRMMSHTLKYCLLSNQSGVRCCRLLLCYIAMTKYMSSTQLTYLTKISFCRAAILVVISHNKSSIKGEFVVIGLTCRPVELVKFSNEKKKSVKLPATNIISLSRNLNV